MKKEFFQVPNDIFDRGLSNNEMLVLMYMMRCMDNKTNICYPSYEKICKACGITRSTAIKAVKTLSTSGFIKCIKKGYSAEYGQKFANTYVVNDLHKHK